MGSGAWVYFSLWERVAVGTGHAPVAGSPALRQSRSSETTPAGRQSPSSKTHPRPARVPHSETSPAPPAADKLPSPTALYRRVPGQGSFRVPITTVLLVDYSSVNSSGSCTHSLHYAYMSYRHIPSPTQSPNSTRFRYRTITTITETPIVLFYIMLLYYHRCYHCCNW